MKGPFSRKQRYHVNFFFDDDECCYKMTVAEGSVERCFTVTVRACDNPCCACQSVRLVCTPEHRNDTEGCLVVLDVRERCVAQPREDTREHDLAFAKVIAEGMENAGWVLLLSILYGAKRDQMQVMDLDALDAKFPPKIMDGDGSVAGYAEIFPFAEWFSFATGGVEWVVDDQYCVNPKCKCHDVMLTFMTVSPDKQTEGKLSAGGAAVTIRFDYRRRSFEVLQESGIPAVPFVDLIAALRKAYPDLATTFGERQRQLRYLFDRAKRKLQTVRDSGGNTGRNAPCPCGSGKRYKRCCGG